MLLRILKVLLLFVIVLALTLWLRLEQSTLTLELNNYIFSTSLFKAIILFLIIYLPYRFLRFIFKNIITKTHSLSYARNLIRLLKANKQLQEKFLVSEFLQSDKLSLEVLNTKASIKSIKHLRLFIDTIKEKDITTAGLLFTNKKVKDDLKPIYLQYLVELALLINDNASFKSYCKMGLDLAPSSSNLANLTEWFFYKLAVFYVNNNLLDDLIDLDKLKTKTRNNSLYYEHAICLIGYNLAKHYQNTNKMSLFNSTLEDLIKKYPSFLPAYKLLLDANYANAKETNKLLLKMWQFNKTYLAIDLFINYYKNTDYKKLQEDLEDIFKDSTNQNTLLLICALNIKFAKYLEAHDILYKVEDSNLIKHIISITLLQKENKIDYLRFNINALIDNLLLEQNWWHNIIKI